MNIDYGKWEVVQEAKIVSGLIRRNTAAPAALIPLMKLRRDIDIN